VAVGEGKAGDSLRWSDTERGRHIKGGVLTKEEEGRRRRRTGEEEGGESRMGVASREEEWDGRVAGEEDVDVPGSVPESLEQDQAGAAQQAAGEAVVEGGDAAVRGHGDGSNRLRDDAGDDGAEAGISSMADGDVVVDVAAAAPSQELEVDTAFEGGGGGGGGEGQDSPTEKLTRAHSILKNGTRWGMWSTTASSLSLSISLSLVPTLLTLRPPSSHFRLLLYQHPPQNPTPIIPTP
jgi:hypothetical protein